MPDKSEINPAEDEGAIDVTARAGVDWESLDEFKRIAVRDIALDILRTPEAPALARYYYDRGRADAAAIVDSVAEVATSAFNNPEKRKQMSVEYLEGRMDALNALADALVPGREGKTRSEAEQGEQSREAA